MAHKLALVTRLNKERRAITMEERKRRETASCPLLALAIAMNE